MRKIITSLLILAMLISLVACAAPAADTAPSDAPAHTEEATPSPTAEPTPTPEPTMSPEEIEQKEIMAEYDKYKMYYETYGDDYALLFIKDMVDEGKITEDLLEAVNSGNYSDEESWKYLRISFNDSYNILNGKNEEMYPEALDSVQSLLLEDSYSRVLRITYLETDTQRERLIAAANTISEWYKNPTDENRIKMEDAYFSDQLTPAEEQILFYWMLSYKIELGSIQVNGETYDVAAYRNLIIDIYGASIGEIHRETSQKLIELNNTPNSEKDWLTENETE